MELNINVDAELNRKIAEYQRMSGIADPEAFHDWVRQETGVAFEDAREVWRNELLRQGVIAEEVYRKIAVPRGDLIRCYEEHRAAFMREESVTVREIQISVKGNAPGMEKARNLIGTARDGGLLGTFTRGRLARPLEDAVFGQSAGYVTEPIQLGSVIEILRVDAKTDSGQASFEEAKNEIYERVAEPLAQARLREYLTELRHSAFIRIRNGYVDDGAAAGKDTSWQEAPVLRPQTVTRGELAKRRRWWMLR